jgi:hypothetical protein
MLIWRLLVVDVGKPFFGVSAGDIVGFAQIMETFVVLPVFLLLFCFFYFCCKILWWFLQWKLTGGPVWSKKKTHPRALLCVDGECNVLSIMPHCLQIVFEVVHVKLHALANATKSPN